MFEERQGTNMKITKSQLRRIIKEAQMLSPKDVYIPSKSDYDEMNVHADSERDARKDRYPASGPPTDHLDHPSALDQYDDVEWDEEGLPYRFDKGGNYVDLAHLMEEGKIKISKRQLRRIIKEEKQRAIIKRRLAKRLQEEQGYDAREDERLGAMLGALGGKDFAGDHEEAEHARRDDAGFEKKDDHTVHVHHHHHHGQGYDASEDEKLSAEHGAERDHEQSLKDRRDDAGFEMRHENAQRSGRKIRISKKQLLRIIREERARIK